MKKQILILATLLLAGCSFSSSAMEKKEKTEISSENLPSSSRKQQIECFQIVIEKFDEIEKDFKRTIEDMKKLTNKVQEHKNTLKMLKESSEKENTTTENEIKNKQSFNEMHIRMLKDLECASSVLGSEPQKYKQRVHFWARKSDALVHYNYKINYLTKQEVDEYRKIISEKINKISDLYTPLNENMKRMTEEIKSIEPF